ncbi:MAG: phosphatase PAP2 family protein [Bacteroidetes bacterium]|nr:phosphatase PAP2 family protein [Bacteroidota bacterium]
MSTPILLTSFVENIWEWLRYADTRLFLKMNTAWTNPLLDSIYPWYREANAWVPLYLFLIVFAIMNFKEKALPWILFAVLTATLTDQLSSSVIKKLIERPRPCREELLMGQVRLILNTCSGGYSFPSSHATNHFGFAMFLFLTLRPIMKKWAYVFFIWAATIAYGQVYVGVHYPLDILAGALLGCLIGYFTGTYFNKRIGLPQAE